MFKSSANYSKLKTNLRLSIHRLKLLEKKKAEIALKSRKEIADYIQAAKDDRARIRVEHIIREDFLVEALEILEMYCDLLLARFGLMEKTAEVDASLEEAIATIIWAEPRVSSDCFELREICKQFMAKYGKDFVAACRSNQLNNVNERVMKKLSVYSPSKVLVENYMIEIARSYDIPFVPDPLVMEGMGADLTDCDDLLHLEGTAYPPGPPGVGPPYPPGPPGGGSYPPGPPGGSHPYPPGPPKGGGGGGGGGMGVPASHLPSAGPHPTLPSPSYPPGNPAFPQSYPPPGQSYPPTSPGIPPRPSAGDSYQPGQPGPHQASYGGPIPPGVSPPGYAPPSSGPSPAPRPPAGQPTIPARPNQPADASPPPQYSSAVGGRKQPGSEGGPPSAPPDGDLDLGLPSAPTNDMFSLPSVPVDGSVASPKGGDDIDFDDLAARFEALKKTK